MAPQFETRPLALELDDASFGHRLLIGSVVGIPVIFVITLFVAAYGAGWGSAFVIALWAAVVGGPFAGGFVAVMLGTAEPRTTGAVHHLRPRHLHVGHRRHAA